MSSLQGLKFHLMEKKGKCKNCEQSIEKGCKSILIGYYSNIYRYCVKCFLISIEDEFNVEILDFIEEN